MHFNTRVNQTIRASLIAGIEETKISFLFTSLKLVLNFGRTKNWWRWTLLVSQWVICATTLVALGRAPTLTLSSQLPLGSKGVCLPPANNSDLIEHTRVTSKLKRKRRVNSELPQRQWRSGSIFSTLPSILTRAAQILSGGLNKGLLTNKPL